MEVLFFGSLADIVTAQRLSLDNQQDTDAVKQYLEEKYPSLKQSKYFLAVNKQMIQQNTTLQPGDTIALMPPFSGG